MSISSRKLRRHKEKEAQKELKKKIGLFNKLPDYCLFCKKDFDKKDKEMVMSWSVVVRKEEESVRLYCPDCWARAKKIIEEIKDGYTNAKTDV
tara:strand:+ start:377 stop:655 length:279 start_codon:yes stop_codon:yes gene_type:complete